MFWLGGDSECRNLGNRGVGLRTLLTMLQLSKNEAILKALVKNIIIRGDGMEIEKLE